MTSEPSVSELLRLQDAVIAAAERWLDRRTEWADGPQDSVTEREARAALGRSSAALAAAVVAYRTYRAQWLPRQAAAKDATPS